MQWLHKAVQAGYKDAAYMEKDEDLDPLYERAQFQKLLAALIFMFAEPLLCFRQATGNSAWKTLVRN